jgi:hypothetical protein
LNRRALIRILVDDYGEAIVDGMNYFSNRVSNTDGPISFSDHIEIPPRSTIGQATLSGYLDQTDPNASHISFTHCEFIDDDGVQRSADLNHTNAFSRNRLVRVDLLASGINGEFEFLINLFFWPSVF